MKKVFGYCYTCFLLLVILEVNTIFAEEFLALPESRSPQISNQILVFDFKRSGCLPAVAISREGKQNPGLEIASRRVEGCRAENFLKTSNTYHRYACTSFISQGAPKIEYCGHFYALYFQKDQVFNHIGGGHRHDIEYTAIWTKNGQATHASLTTREVSRISKQQGTNFRFVAQRQPFNTNSTRFTKKNERVDNEYEEFVLPPILS